MNHSPPFIVLQQSFWLLAEKRSFAVQNDVHILGTQDEAAAVF